MSNLFRFLNSILKMSLNLKNKSIPYITGTLLGLLSTWDLDSCSDNDSNDVKRDDDYVHKCARNVYQKLMESNKILTNFDSKYANDDISLNVLVINYLVEYFPINIVKILFEYFMDKNAAFDVDDYIQVCILYVYIVYKNTTQPS